MSASLSVREHPVTAFSETSPEPRHPSMDAEGYPIRETSHTLANDQDGRHPGFLPPWSPSDPEGTLEVV